jgi:alpha-beta hydrolase superfamily lysophospholipase
LNAKPVTFASDSGATVYGWWCPIQNAKGAVLLLPGIRANRLSMVERARFLRRAGYSVLLIDFQATGETKGDHITFGWRESQDVLAARDFIRQSNPKIPAAIIGSSLGGVAALLATPPLKIDALVLEEVYPTIEIAARNRMENYLGLFGRRLTPLLLNQLQWRLGVSASQLRPVDHIENVECPLLIISGENDRNTRPTDTRMLVERARNPKDVWFVPNVGHVDLHRAAREEYETRVLAFLAKSAIVPRER